MAQRRFWNYLDNDSTFDMNLREFMLRDAGRYRGFDLQSASLLTTELTLGQASGTQPVSIGQVLQPLTGAWLSNQGVLVTENAAITIAFGANATSNPRIDLVIGRHEYVATVGGAVATYSVVQGTAAANPVAPALPLPLKDVIIGRIYVPAGTTLGIDVTYTPEPVPDHAGDDTIAHIDRLNTWSAHQIFNGVYGDVGVAKIDAGGVINIGLSSYFDGITWFRALPHANILILVPGTATISADGFYEINSIAGGSTASRDLTVLSYAPLKINAGGSIFVSSLSDAYVPFLGTIALTKFKTNWALMSGAEARKNSVNKMQKLFALSDEACTIDINGGVARANEGNHLKLTVASGQIFKWLQSTRHLGTTAPEKGTVLTISVEDNNLRIETILNPANHTQTAPPTNYKRIYVPMTGDTYVRRGGSVTLVEMEDYWLVTSITGQLPCFYPMTDGVFTCDNAEVGAMNGVLYLRGTLFHNSGTLAQDTPINLALFPLIYDFKHSGVAIHTPTPTNFGAWRTNFRIGSTYGTAGAVIDALAYGDAPVEIILLSGAALVANKYTNLPNAEKRLFLGGFSLPR
jgi:hypothetical protein